MREEAGEETDRLIEAAGRVADGAEVDWKSLARALPAERAAVEALRRLAALSAATDTPGSPRSEVPSAEEPPWRWGHLQVRERLGEGAFGEVWRAFDPVLSREVALKLRRAGSRDGPAAHNFLEEARHLARVRHPNVLGVHGADVHAGRVGLWTDLVSGRTLREVVAEDGPLQAHRTIEIGRALADALGAVHRTGLVHGDVKPSNVMLEAEGARVILMDFGAAAPESHVGRFGSPLSMAPELLAGARPTARSDVYSLGVLLYFLLAGRYPVAAESLRELAERHRTGLAERVARGLRAPLALRRLVGRLLACDPSARPDALQVVELIDRIRGAPGRRRRRLAVATVIASLAAGVTLAGLGYVRARGEARRAQEARDFLVGLFEGADPNWARGRTVTAQELLDRGAERLRSDLAGERALRAEMLGVVGRLYLQLGLFDQSRPLLEEALATRREREDGDGAMAESAGDLASVLSELGEYGAAETLAREALAARRARAAEDPAALAASLADLAAVLSVRGEADEADTLYREAVGIDRRLADQPALAEHVAGHGTALWRAARYDEARMAHEEALAIERTLYGEEHTVVATTLLDLGTDLMEMGQFAEAEALLRECLAMRRKLLGDAHPHVAAAYGNLGDVLQRAGRLREAEDAHRTALAINRAALGESHPDVANSLNHVGVLLYFQSRYREAAATFEQVLPSWRASYGPDHPNVFAVLNNLGAALREAGELDAAERVLRETLELRRQAFGDDHPDVAQSLSNLAVLLGRVGRDAEAEAAFRQATATWRSTLGGAHANVGSGLADLGRLLVDRGRFGEAEPVLREAVAIRMAALDPKAPLLASARLYLGECLLGMGRGAEAAALLSAALPVLVETWGEDHEATRRARRAIAGLGGPSPDPGP